MKRICLIAYLAFIVFKLQAQVKWVNVDSLFGNLTASVHVYKTTDPLDGKPNIAYYVEADLKDRSLNFTCDTTYKRRLTPQQFYARNNNPPVVVNCTFFSFVFAYLRTSSIVFQVHGIEENQSYHLILHLTGHSVE